MININIGDIFKSAGTFLIKNWQGVGLVVMLILFFVTKNDYASLKKSMEVMSTSYEEQIAAIEELHKKEVAARAAAIIDKRRRYRRVHKGLRRAARRASQRNHRDLWV